MGTSKNMPLWIPACLGGQLWGVFFKSPMHFWTCLSKSTCYYDYHFQKFWEGTFPLYNDQSPAAFCQIPDEKNLDKNHALQIFGKDQLKLKNFDKNFFE